jgi:hypothetical protein
VKRLLEKYHSYLQESIGACKSACETLDGRMVELQSAQDSTTATIEEVRAMTETAALMQEIQDTEEWQQQVAKHKQRKEETAARDAERREQQMKEVLQSPRLRVNQQAQLSPTSASGSPGAVNPNAAGSSPNVAGDDLQGSSLKAPVEVVDEDDDEGDTAGGTGMVWSATCRQYVERHSTDSDAWRRS